MLCSELGIRRKRPGVGGSNEFDIENFPFGYLLMSWAVPKDLGKCMELKVPVGQWDRSDHEVLDHFRAGKRTEALLTSYHEDYYSVLPPLVAVNIW